METNTDVKSVLEKLGYRLSDFGDAWRTSALYRGGDNPTALKIYKNTGVWTDYVDGLILKNLLVLSIIILTQRYKWRKLFQKKL